jgi:hypothetical protein
MRVWRWVLAVPVLAACSLAYLQDRLGEATSPDGGARDGAVLHDAADARPEASRDSGAGDTGTHPAVPDASLEAGWCNEHPGHLLCSDFDTEGLPGPWSSVITSLPDGGVAAVDPDVSFSAPNSFLSRMPAVANDMMGARLTFGLPLSATSCRLQFMLRLPSTSSGSGTSNIAGFYELQPGYVGYIELQLVDSSYLQVYVSEPPAYYVMPVMAGPLAPSTWYEVVLTIDRSLSDGGYSFTIAADGGSTITASAHNSGIITESPDAATYQLSLGLLAEADHATAANFDNVLLDCP